MALTTGIGWTDATFNPWIGCTHYGPGCHNCYADAFSKRRLGVTFGKGEDRRRTKDWTGPVKLNRRAEASGKPLWLFIASLADVFDPEVPPEWRRDLWDLIRPLTHLRIQIVTKRIGMASEMLPPDWRENFGHVGLIATIVTQREADRDIPVLLTTPARWRGLSMEPLLERVTLTRWVRYLDWVIVGGESGPGAREFHLEWAEDLALECIGARVPFFMKQLGDRPRHTAPLSPGKPAVTLPVKASRMGKDPSEWPERLRIQEMPRAYDVAA